MAKAKRTRKPVDRTTSGDLKPLYCYMPVEAWKLVDEVGRLRAEEAAGVIPNRADLWREAMMRGLRVMLEKAGSAR